MFQLLRQFVVFLQFRWRLRLYAGISTGLFACLFYWGPLEHTGFLSSGLPILMAAGIAAGGIILPHFILRREMGVLRRIFLVFLGGAATFVATAVLFYIGWLPIASLLDMNVKSSIGEAFAAAAVLALLAGIISPLLSPIGGIAALLLEGLLIVGSRLRKVF